MRLLPRLLPLLLLLSSCARKSDGVHVFAAASLKEVVTEIGADFEARVGVPVRLSFASSSELARQIEAGAPADVFITADARWLERLAAAQRFDWLGNRLVLVAREELQPADLHALKSLALGGEGVPAGRYAAAALQSLGLPLPETIVYGSSVRDVLSKVASGGAQAGVVYATDAAVEPRVKVVYEFPPDSHPPILYVAAALTEDGRTFLNALKEPWASERARTRGFLVR